MIDCVSTTLAVAGMTNWFYNICIHPVLICPIVHQCAGQHGHLSGGLHPAHAHMHSGWYTSGMAGLGASGGLQGGFSSGGLSGGVVPHSQSYHLGISSMVSVNLCLEALYSTDIR